jgi:hypothetical protein
VAREVLDAAVGAHLLEGIMRKLNVELMVTKVKHLAVYGSKERWGSGGEGGRG